VPVLHGISREHYAMHTTQLFIDQSGISVWECIFLGMQKILLKFDLAFPNNVLTASLNVKSKTNRCKLTMVSACL